METPRRRSLESRALRAQAEHVDDVVRLGEPVLGGEGRLPQEDAVAAAKVVAEFAKTNDKLVIRAGVYGGKVLDIEGVKQLASIPSKEVLLAQLCGLLMSPISRTAVVLGALAAKKGEGAAAPAEAAAEPAAEPAAPAEDAAAA